MPSAYSRCDGRGSRALHRRLAPAPAFHPARRNTRLAFRCARVTEPESSGAGCRYSRDFGRPNERAEESALVFASRLDVDRAESRVAEKGSIFAFFERAGDAADFSLDALAHVIRNLTTMHNVGHRESSARLENAERLAQ